MATLKGIGTKVMVWDIDPEVKAGAFMHNSERWVELTIAGRASSDSMERLDLQVSRHAAWNIVIALMEALKQPLD